MRPPAALLFGALLGGCAGTFSDDVLFLKGHTETVVLADRDGMARVAVCPALQGRVMTSTASGAGGLSFGWINYDLIESKKTKPHINVYGGEDRFWLGPEGGPFSIFFAKGAPQDLEHWQTPAPIDTEPFILAERSETRALLRKSIRLANASGATFELEVSREIRLLAAEDAWEAVKVAPRLNVNVVAFESSNRVTNSGKEAWRKETGLLSVWILGMFNPSPETTVVVPYRHGPGPRVNDSYFGKVPPDRLIVRRKQAAPAPGEPPDAGVLFFKGDGQHRSKIGIPPGRAHPVLGSWDAAHRVLTVVTTTISEGAPYVNSVWGEQKDPYSGDALNSYNDGPAAPGAKPLGPFYELETSSPALALKPGQSARHVHRTLHFLGPLEGLDEIARATLGVPLAEIEAAFRK